MTLSLKIKVKIWQNTGCVFLVKTLTNRKDMLHRDIPDVSFVAIFRIFIFMNFSKFRTPSPNNNGGEVGIRGFGWGEHICCYFGLQLLA